MSGIEETVQDSVVGPSDWLRDGYKRAFAKESLKEAKSGAEARDGTVAAANMQFELPYRQSYQFNEFDNLTVRNNLHWGIDYDGGVISIRPLHIQITEKREINTIPTGG